MFRSFWPSLKRWRTLGFGPISLVFSFQRRVRVTPGSVVCAVDSSPGNVPGMAAVAVIVGAGPGLGYSLASCLANAGYRLVLVRRDANSLHELVNRLSSKSPAVAAIGCDVTDEKQVNSLFERVSSEFGTPELVIYSLQSFNPGSVLETSSSAFESSWRHNCFGAFLVCRAAGQMMVQEGAGSIILVGSTSSILGREEHLNLAVGKFGERALAQVLARELWPKGIHVAHVLVDADIYEGEKQQHPQADPDDIAYSVLAVHRQPSSAWTSELDLRPAKERFWEHC